MTTAHPAAPAHRQHPLTALPQAQWPIGQALLALLDRLLPEHGAAGVSTRQDGLPAPLAQATLKAPTGASARTEVRKAAGTPRRTPARSAMGARASA
jgi:hypothetical protein